MGKESTVPVWDFAGFEPTLAAAGWFEGACSDRQVGWVAVLRSASGICVPAAQASLNCLRSAHLKCFVFGIVNIVLIYIYIFTHPYMHFYKEACTHVCAYAVFSGSSLGLEGTLGNHRNSNLLPSC